MTEPAVSMQQLVDLVVSAYPGDAASMRTVADTHRQFAEALTARANELDPPLKVYAVYMEVSADAVIKVRAQDPDTARQVASAAAAEGLYAIDMGAEMWLDTEDAQELAEAQGDRGDWTLVGHSTSDERVSVLRVQESSDG